jgi:uncharacterized membrane protein
MPGYHGDAAGWMSGMMGGFGNGNPWFGLLTLATFVVVGLAIAYALSRPRSGGDEPLEIVRRRYARGELSADEFEAAQKALS